MTIVQIYQMILLDCLLHVFFQHILQMNIYMQEIQNVLEFVAENVRDKKSLSFLKCKSQEVRFHISNNILPRRRLYIPIEGCQTV